MLAFCPLSRVASSLASHNSLNLCYNSIVANVPLNPATGGRCVVMLVDFLLAVAACALGGIIAYFACKALERYFGNK